MGDEALARSLRRKGIADERVLGAVAALERAAFVEEDLRGEAGGDYPLPIGFGQTISQPFVVALMTQALSLDGTERVLEVGTGSGYQTAVLARLAKDVFSVEIIPELCESAAARLSALGLLNVHVRCADGSGGWPEAAPFDAVLLTAAPEVVPPALFQQLRLGGRLLAPVGNVEDGQELVRFDRLEDGTSRPRVLLPVRFVPMLHGPQFGLTS